MREKVVEKGGFINTEKQKTQLQMEFDNNTLLPVLFGEHNVHLVQIENTLDVVLHTRGNKLVISGSMDNANIAYKVINELYVQVKTGQEIVSSDVEGALNVSMQAIHFNSHGESVHNLCPIVYSMKELERLLL